jgi:hypothetical protein
MSMLVVRLDTGDVDKGFTALTGSQRDRASAGAFARLKDPLKLDQQEHKKDQAGPDGKWAARAQSTIARRRYKGHRAAARPLGRAPTAIQYTSDSKGVYGRSRLSYWQVLQDGGRVGRGHKSLLVARVFWWISDQVLDVATTFYVDYFRDAWERGR